MYNKGWTIEVDCAWWLRCAHGGSCAWVGSHSGYINLPSLLYLRPSGYFGIFWGWASSRFTAAGGAFQLPSRAGTHFSLQVGDLWGLLFSCQAILPMLLYSGQKQRPMRCSGCLFSVPAHPIICNTVFQLHVPWCRTAQSVAGSRLASQPGSPSATCSTLKYLRGIYIHTTYIAF